jgi:Holliday junction resolvase RusA-like endonuclease
MTYNDQQTEESRALMEIRQQWQRPTLSGPISVDLTFVFQRPKSHYGTGKNDGVLKTTAPQLHTKKPDLDNCCKFYLDVCNSEVWLDDSIIFYLSAKKIYGDQPCTKIVIAT